MSFRLSEIQEATGFYDNFFGPETIFVPIPGSAPLLPNENRLWVPKLIAEELVKAGLGASVMPILQRHTAVRKSATAPTGERPSVDAHLQTMALSQIVLLNPHHRIVMVDDVLTRGRTMCAAYAILKQAYPENPVLGFATFRTQGFVENITVMTDPATGIVSFNGFDSSREP